MEKKFSYMSEEITTDGGLTGRVIRFDEPILEKSKRHDESFGAYQPQERVRKKPGPKPKAKPVAVEPVVPPQAVPVPKNPTIPPRSDLPSFKALGSLIKDERERELLCFSTAVNRENEALRKYNEWLTSRIETLERKIYELTHGQQCSCSSSAEEQVSPVTVIHHWTD